MSNFHGSVVRVLSETSVVVYKMQMVSTHLMRNHESSEEHTLIGPLPVSLNVPWLPSGDVDQCDEDGRYLDVGLVNGINGEPPESRTP